MGLNFGMEKSDNTKAYKPNSEQEAWIGILYVSANSDGHISDAEISHMARTITYKKIFQEFNVLELYKKVAYFASNNGNDILLDLCVPLISEEWKATLFTLAVEMVVGDGNLEQTEIKTIEKLYKKLDIENDLAQRIVDVMLIRQKGNHILVDSDDDDDDYDENDY